MRHGRGTIFRRPLPSAFRVFTLADVTPPIVNITVAPSASKISRISGKDITTFSFQSSENYSTYELRVVPSSLSPHTAGTLLETGGGLLQEDYGAIVQENSKGMTTESGGAGLANADRAVDVTDDELIEALGVEGINIIKVFVRDAAGNWST